MAIHSFSLPAGLVKLHPDVESGSQTAAVFLVGPGAIATGGAAAPTTHRDSHVGIIL